MRDLHALLDAMGDHDGTGVRVAVIDTGVQHDHPWLNQTDGGKSGGQSEGKSRGQLAESYGIRLFDDGQIDIEPCKPLDVCGHGTASAGQIRRIAPGVELVSIRVLSESREGSSEALVSALQWLAGRGDISVVNMSLSTLRLSLALRIGQAVDELYARGVPCVCAKGYQQDGRDYPTSFGASIGVTYADIQPAELRYREGDLVEFEAAGVDQIVAWHHGATRKVTGSSYATPLVTGLVARLLAAEPSLSVFEVKTLLKAYAARYAVGWRADWMVEAGKRLACRAT